MDTSVIEIFPESWNTNIEFMVRRLPHRDSSLRDDGHDDELEIMVTINETIPGTALDKRLRREQTKAILELVTAHLSRVHIAPAPAPKEKPRE